METGVVGRSLPLLRHRALRQVLQTGLFDGEPSGFALFEGALARLSREAPTKKLVGDVWEVFSEAYFLTEPMVQAEEVWPISAVPPEILGAMNLGIGDIGCDGIFRRRDGSLAAYQAKFRSSREALTWRELSTFVGSSERAAERMVLTNSDDLAEHALSRDRFMAIRGTDLEHLDAARMGEIFALVNGMRRTRAPKRPLPHQDVAVARIVAKLAVEDRATVLMACGSGKTLSALWAAQAMSAGTVLVLVPSLSLVRQTLLEWSREQPWGEAFRFVVVCSDDTVADDDAIEMKQSDLPFAVTSDAGVVRRFLSSRVGTVSVVFATYQSAPRVAEGVPDAFRFDLGIFDEAHRTAGHAGGTFSLALRDENLPIAKRLFMTATRRVHSARVKDKVKLILSMDDKALYGPIAHELSFREAAELGIVCHCRAIISVVTRADVAAAISGGDVVEEGEVMEASDAAMRIAFACAVKVYGLVKAITFHRTVRGARLFAAGGARGPLAALPPGFRLFHVSGKMKAADRDRELGRFRAAPTAAVSNARCLTEGTDLPAVDLVAFMSPKGSQVDIVQAIGRALRKPVGGGKEFGYVLVPLFLNEEVGEDFDAAVHRRDFGPVWEVVRALMDQDASMTETIDDLRAGRTRPGGAGRGLGDYLEVIGPAITLDRLREAIGVRIVEQLGDPFEVGLAHMEAFVAREGHALVSTGQVEPDGYRLGAWVNNRRTYRRKLPPQQAARLEALPGWTWRPYDDQFENGLRHLRAYAAREGHALVPGLHHERGFALGGWVNSRRRERGTLSEAIRVRLEAVPGWSWDARDNAFEEGFGYLLAYAAHKGHARPPASHVESGFPLGRWVSKRRSSKDRMPPWHQERLEALDGWEWNAREDGFERGLMHLRAFTERMGHARPLFTHKEGDFPLGGWVVARRGDQEQLSEDQRAKLEALPGWVWNTFENRFEQGMRHLEAYVRREGTTLVPTSHVEGEFKLGRWVIERRVAVHNMPPDQRARLERLPGWAWNTRDFKFEEGFSRLVAYAQDHGHAYPSPNLVETDGFKLGYWVAYRRKFKGRLTEEQTSRLETVPGWSWRMP
jgi:superfamily II DNA or RNA helicase